MEDIQLNNSTRDALKEIGNICAGNAATALSQLVTKKVTINVPEIFLTLIEKTPQVMGEDQPVVGLMVRVLGDLPSFFLLAFSQDDALSLASLITHKKYEKNAIIKETERIALKEIGMVIANAYLGTLSTFVKLNLVPTTPDVIIDMSTAIIDALLIELSEACQYALLIKSEFQEVSTKVIGHFFLIPNPKGLEIILKAAGG